MRKRRRETRIVRWLYAGRWLLIGAGLLVFLGMAIGSIADLSAPYNKYELDCCRVAKEEAAFNRMVKFCREERRLNERYVYDCGKVARDMKRLQEKVAVCKFIR